MFLTPFNYVIVYTFAMLGLILIGARHLMLWAAGLLLLIIPVEVMIRLVNIIL
jgi:hypothetical protein